MLYFWVLQLRRKWTQFTIPTNHMWTWLNTSEKFWVVLIFTDKATSISIQFLVSWPICKQPYPYFWKQDHTHKSTLIYTPQNLEYCATGHVHIFFLVCCISEYCSWEGRVASHNACGLKTCSISQITTTYVRDYSYESCPQSLCITHTRVVSLTRVTRPITQPQWLS